MVRFIYDTQNVSSGIAASSSQFGPLIGVSTIAFRKAAPSITFSVRIQLFDDGSAAFFSESIIREIITGRYLQPPVSHECGPRTGCGSHTRTPLIMGKKSVIKVVASMVRPGATYVPGRSWIVT